MTLGDALIVLVAGFGAGLIGCEAASCCRDLGLPVTLLDPNPTPLARSLGTWIGGA